MNKVIASVLVLGALFIGGYAVHVDRQLNALQEKLETVGSPETNRIQSYTRSTGVVVSTSSTEVAATNTARTLLRISNIASKPIYCKMRSGDLNQAAVMYEGMLVAASSTVEITGENLYTGPVNCIAESSASTTVLEK